MIGAAVLLLIASFLPFYSVGSESRNLWHSDWFPTLPSVTLAALVVAGAVLLARAPQFAGKQVLGLSFDQWAVSLSLFVGWTAVWATLFHNPDGVDKGSGNWLTLLFGLAIAAVALAHFKLGLDAVWSFWIAYILTRPLGASIGDYLSQPTGDGGVGLGTVITSALFLTVILGLVVYLAITRKDVAEPQRAARHAA